MGTVPSASPPRVMPPINSARPVPPAYTLRGPFDARPGTYSPHFDARPGTYRPRYDRPWNGYGNGYRNGYYYGGGGWLYDDSPLTAPAPPPEPAPPYLAVAEPQGQPVASAPLPESPPPVLHHPDTFYVIAGCYVGNQRPKQEQLPKGCDLSKMKAVPVQ